MSKSGDLVALVREIYGEGVVDLHRPVLSGAEKAYVGQCIDENFVSSVGQRVLDFEDAVADYTGARYAVAVVNGTCALQVALRLAGVAPGEEVITQALTFVATCNAIAHAGGQPVFVDVERATLGLCPAALERFLNAQAESGPDGCVNRTTGKRIAACLPMHTFGHPCDIERIISICDDWGIAVVEDAAESLGSYRGERHTGTFGRLGVFSFNGNKIVTTGGGGMIVTDDEALARRAKHLTTTARVPHAYEYYHDELGYNFRLPNLNAALGCAQMEQLEGFLAAKREVAGRYAAFCDEHGIEFVREPAGARSNYWLNAVILDSRAERKEFLQFTNEKGVMTRPIWTLMTDLPMYADCQHDGLEVSRWLEDQVVCLPSSVPDRSKEQGSRNKEERRAKERGKLRGG